MARQAPVRRVGRALVSIVVLAAPWAAQRPSLKRSTAIRVHARSLRAAGHRHRMRMASQEPVAEGREARSHGAAAAAIAVPAAKQWPRTRAASTASLGGIGSRERCESAFARCDQRMATVTLTRGCRRTTSVPFSAATVANTQQRHGNMMCCKPTPVREAAVPSPDSAFHTVLGPPGTVVTMAMIGMINLIRLAVTFFLVLILIVISQSPLYLARLRRNHPDLQCDSMHQWSAGALCDLLVKDKVRGRWDGFPMESMIDSCTAMAKDTEDTERTVVKQRKAIPCMTRGLKEDTVPSLGLPWTNVADAPWGDHQRVPSLRLEPLQRAAAA